MLPLQFRLNTLWQQPQILAQKYPLETLFIVIFSLPFLLLNKALLEPLAIYWLFVPMFFILTYLCRRYKIAYWLSAAIPPLVLFWQASSHLTTADYLTDRRFWALALTMFICLLANGWHKNNRTFVARLLKMVVNLAWSLLITGISIALLLSIIFSVDYLFKLNFRMEEIALRVYFFSLFALIPLFFLVFEEKDFEREAGLTGFSEVILNLILSPTLMIYSVIIYLYALRILILGELPQGQITFIVLPYLLFGLSCSALRLLLTQPKWQRFYRTFAWIALLPLVLLWFGVYTRLSSYGLTETRIYLLVVTTLTTLFVGLSLFKTTTQYRIFIASMLTAIVLFGFVFNPQQIALESQQARFEQQLQALNLLDQQGKLKPLPQEQEWKTVSEQQLQQYVELSETLRYLAYHHDREALEQRYGSENVSNWMYLPAYETSRGEVTEDISASSYIRFFESGENELFDATQYTKVLITSQYISTPENVSGKSVILDLSAEGITFQFDLQAELETQLQQAGFELGKQYDEQILQSLAERILRMENEQGTLIFSSFSIHYQPSVGYVFNNAYLKAALQK